MKNVNKKIGFKIRLARESKNITRELFYRLAYATTVAVKIVGRDYNLERAIHPAVLARYRRFYDEIIK